MKPVDKKDMPKLIALIGLTVCALGYGIYSLVGSTATAAPPPKKEEKAATSPANGAAPGAVAAADDPMMLGLKRLEGLSEPVLVRDPFTVPGAPAAGAQPGAPGTTPVAPSAPAPQAPVKNPLEAKQDIAMANAAARGKSLRELLGLEVKPARGGGEDLTGSSPAAPGASSVVPMKLPPPQPPNIVVTGVLVAENGQGESVAIVRVNDKPRWLSIGDRLEGGFVVRSIRRTDRGSELEIVDSNDKSRRFPFKVN
ncbi:hypothetical protein [Armatimonas rosea]|uniref:Type II secretion system protein GspC N-terminal domain-containing protein n=1 Tax=Armatimonas rosea TaxID=685828 RepID=A0A7W9SMX9_ARMRO|nr:hypothetical protein [Armatimonas rosea]MBB6049300.1 hypothetical protein [Armatimonas rosea]